MAPSKAKAISFTPDVLKAKLRALEAHGLAMTCRPLRLPNPEKCPSFAEADLSKAWADNTSPFSPCLKVPCAEGTVQRVHAPHEVGDFLWARERAEVLALNVDGSEMRIRYALDGEEAMVEWPERIVGAVVGHCLPNGVHREGARHFFEVVGVKAERVCNISEEDAVLEGIQCFRLPLVGASGAKVYAMEWPSPFAADTPRDAFRLIWESLYGPEAWEHWCWVYALRRATP